MLEAKGLVKLGILYGEELDVYSWWCSLAAKLAVSVRMDLVADKATDKKGATSSNTLGMKFPLLSLS